MLNFFRKIYKTDINIDSDELSIDSDISNFKDFLDNNRSRILYGEKLSLDEQKIICPVIISEIDNEGVIDYRLQKNPILELDWIKHPGLDIIREELKIKDTLWITWLAGTGDFIKTGDVICKYEYEYTELRFKSTIVANRTGIFEVYFSEEELERNNFKDGDLIYSIIYDEVSNTEKAERALSKKLQNTPLIMTDNFSLKKEIKWETVGGKSHVLSYSYRDGVELHANTMNKDLLFFTINYKDDKDYIVFRYLPKDYKLFEGSNIFFKFENDEIIRFDLSKKPYFIIGTEGEKLGEFRIQLTKSDLELLTTYYLNNWKINFQDSDLKIEGNINSIDKKFGIRLLARDYCTIIKREVKNYKPLIVKEKAIPSESSKLGKCYLYLMLDNSNGYHKIGISNKPEYREKTLQSEKPDIEMICNKQFPVRRIAYSFEQALHQSYAKKRIRGEWFNLSEEEVNEIKDTLI